jgi:hypothetical protein
MRWGVGVAVLAGVAFLVAWWTVRPPGGGEGAAEVSAPPELVPPGRVRTPLPRRPSTARGPAGVAPQGVAPSAAAAAEPPATQAAERPAAQAPAVPPGELGLALRATFEREMNGSLLECLFEADLPDGYRGELAFELHLDAAGLQEAAVLDLTEVPASLVDCMADATWSADWPRLTEGEVDVTYPVVLTTD